MIKISLKSRHIRILTLIKDQWLRLFIAMACMVLEAGTTAATAFLVKPILDDVFFKQDAVMLKLVPLAILITYFFRGVSMFGHSYLMNYVGHDIIRKLRNELYSRILDLPLSFYHKEKTGGLMSRITNDVNVIREMVSKVVTGSLKDLFTIIGLVFVIFYRDWQMACFAIVILPAAFYPILEFGRRVRRISSDRQESLAELSAFIHETFSGTKIVKAFGMENYEKNRFFKMTQNLFGFEMKTVFAKNISSPVMEVLAGIGIAFIIWYGGSKVMSGSSTPGTFFSFMTAALMLYGPVKSLNKLNNAIQDGLAAADRIFDVIERDSEIKEVANPVALSPGRHHVTFQNVHFKYENDLVLRDINIDVNPGEILAIVGMSGGGKSTMVNLIPRFYDVAEGSIRIDGVDIREMSIASLRKQIAVVTQEPILFNDTIRNNIAYGNKEATDAQIIQAAQAAYAYDFIRGFPRGFDTLVGELGGRLSGGEKQRLCIARALIKNAPILILDEATSSLDTEAEALVQKALENLMRGRTTFVIAHRLSTIAYASRIVVIEKGTIVEEGKHGELIALEGEYYKLYQMQFNNNSQ
jgi:subfamily B ATP-binding cassette protein MsbA